MKASRQLRGAKARDQGRRAEWVAAIWLMLRGWRIIAFRHRTPYGEIDLLVRKADILAVVEVKRRTTLDEALNAVRPEQRRRLLRAAMAVAATRPESGAVSVRLDLVAMAPGRLPAHIEDAWGETH